MQRDSRPVGVLGIGIGIGMALRYDAAFVTLAGLYRSEAWGAITGITLLAGFASTVGWPATALLTNELGWRGACVVWALLHLVLDLPLNRLQVPSAPPPEKVVAPITSDAPAPWAMIILAGVFAATLFVLAALAAHLPRWLLAAGATPAAAVAAGAGVDVQQSHDSGPSAVQNKCQSADII